MQMKKFLKTTLFLLVVVLISCSEGEIEIINDRNNVFEAKIEGREFELSQVQRCAFPNPCSIDGGFSGIFIQNDELEFRVGDVINDFSFGVSIYVTDSNLPMNIRDDGAIDGSKNWASIVLTNEKYVWVDMGDGYSIRKRIQYILESGVVTLNTFNPETFNFSANFSGKFKMIKNSNYTYPKGIDEELMISNGFFRIREDIQAP